MAIQEDVELTFPEHTVTRPVLCETGRQTGVVMNIISANVSQHRGHFHLKLLGDASQIAAAKTFLRDAGITVEVRDSKPYDAPVPNPPAREAVRPGEPRVARKLWITFIGETRREPLTWQMGCKYDVTFDIRQSSTGESVSIMAVLLSGPQSHVEGAIDFLRSKGAEIEPIEKSVIEG